MRLLPILAVLALAGCAVEQSAEGAFANRAAVHHPEALFDVAPRSDLLRRRDPRSGDVRGERVCPRASDLVALGPLMAPSMQALRGVLAYTRAPREFGRALNTRAYRLLLDQDMARAAEDIAALRAHADANAWSPGAANNGAASAVIDGLLPVLPAWHILRQTSVATPEDRQAIEEWLQRLAAYAEVHPGLNSVGTSRGASGMLLGLMLGDDARYREGIESGYYTQLGGMRADGSFPMEADRGLTALENTNRNIALMVYSAEIAASQGTDLYSVRVEGRGLDDAIGFLLAAHADNRLIDGYAAANRNPSDAHPAFRPGAQVDPFTTSAGRAWPKLYAARFPDGPLTEDLLARVEPARRIGHDTVGGYVTCYTGPM